jgi:phage shock protein C
MNDRLYRSRDERIIAGVAGGVAYQFHMDPSLVRILWVILVPLTGGLALALYIIMAFVVPEEPVGDARWAAWERQSGGYQWPDPSVPGSGGAGASETEVAGTAGASPGSSSVAAAGTWPPSGGVASPTTPTPPSWPTPGAPSAPLVPPPNPPWPRDSQSARDSRRDARRAERAERWDGSGAILFGLILIVVGGYFFARTYLPDIDVNRTWPIILIVLGGILLVGAIRRGSNRTP